MKQPYPFNTLFKLISLVLIFTSCDKNTEFTNMQLSDFGLVLKDSIVLDTQASFLKITDYNSSKGCYLAVDILNANIVEFNGKGEILLTLSEANNAENGFGTGYVLGLCYHGEKIAILGSKGLHFYDSKGQLQEKIPQKGVLVANPFNPEMSYVKTKNGDIFIGNAGLVSDEAPAFNSKFFYEKHKNLLLIDLKNKQWLPSFGFESSTLLKNSEFYFGIPFAFFDTSGQTLSLIFAVENEVHHYHLKDNEWKHKNNTITQAAHFPKPKGVKFSEINSRYSPSASYNSLYKSEDLILLTYTTVPASSTNLTAEKVKPKQYLQVFNTEHKMTKDILLPERIKFITHFENMNMILAYRNKEIFRKEPDNEVFYIYSLVKKDDK